MRALLCPGQGSRPAAPLLPVNGSGATARAQERLVRESCAASSLDLPGIVDTVLERPDDAPLGTHVAQPLTVLVSLLSALGAGLLHAEETTQTAPPLAEPGIVVAGHSLGSLTALALAGALTPVQAVRLAAVRGRAMEACCTAPDGTRVGGMVAVVGGRREDVLAQIEAAGLTVANVNGASQVVASGPFAALERLRAPERARLVPLDVAGPFHSPGMARAAPALAAAVGDLPGRVLVRGVVDEATGELYPAGASSRPLLQALPAKLTAPVRWDLVEQRLRELGTDEVTVLAPSQALAGLARRGLPGAVLTRLDAGRTT